MPARPIKEETIFVCDLITFQTRVLSDIKPPQSEAKKLFKNNLFLNPEKKLEIRLSGTSQETTLKILEKIL